MALRSIDVCLVYLINMAHKLDIGVRSYGASSLEPRNIICFTQSVIIAALKRYWELDMQWMIKLAPEERAGYLSFLPLLIVSAHIICPIFRLPFFQQPLRIKLTMLYIGPLKIVST